jgi:hypothetical protein
MSAVGVTEQELKLKRKSAKPEQTDKQMISIFQASQTSFEVSLSQEEFKNDNLDFILKLPILQLLQTVKV